MAQFTWFLTSVDGPGAPRFYQGMYEQLHQLIKTFNTAGAMNYIIKSDLDFLPGKTVQVLIRIEIYHRLYNDPDPIFREHEIIFDGQSTPQTIAERLSLLNYKIRVKCKLD